MLVIESLHSSMTMMSISVNQPRMLQFGCINYGRALKS